MQYLQKTPELHNPFLCLPIPGHRDYLISLAGQVRNVKTGKVLSTTVNRVGSRCYEQCSIGHVHRLLKSALEGRPLATKELVCHLDGDTFHNAPDNLCVGTAHDNARHRIATNSNGHKLKNQDIRDIRRLAGKVPNRDLARWKGVTEGHIRAIIARRVWRNLP